MLMVLGLLQQSAAGCRWLHSTLHLLQPSEAGSLLLISGLVMTPAFVPCRQIVYPVDSWPFKEVMPPAQSRPASSATASAGRHMLQF